MGFLLNSKETNQNFITWKTSQSINIQCRIHDMIEMVNRYFDESKSTFFWKREKLLIKKIYMDGEKDEF